MKHGPMVRLFLSDGHRVWINPAKARYIEELERSNPSVFEYRIHFSDHDWIEAETGNGKPLFGDDSDNEEEA